jgi:lipopolysaccharide/colanic/teichoic acid biosynthesis glycosyltransferase
MLPQPEPLPIVWQKRVFDMLGSLVFLLLTAPLSLLFLLLIFVEHCLRGHPLDPLFYGEERVSRGALFRLYKFNIFNTRVLEHYRSQKKFIHTKELERNGDLIFVGKVLKQIYLDELPQLFNVLKGEMSLVGPRPLNPEVFAMLEANGIPPQALLLGGMTGNFQSLKDTKGVSAHTLETQYLQIYTHANGWYVLYTDIKIIIRTLKVLLRAKGV